MATLPGLIDGSYRGVPFSVVDTTSESGRRLIEYLFPGIDAAAYDDFGRMPGYVTIEALIVGDDYQARAVALEAAFSAPGPATLMHPWLGPMMVVMEEPGQISFSARELRVARISAAFKRVQFGGALSMASGIISAISGLSGAASALSGAVGSQVISVAQSYATARSSRVFGAALSSLVSVAGAGPALAGMRTAMLAAQPAAPAAYDTMVRTVVAPIAVAPTQAAVSPAAEAPATAEVSSLGLMTLGLNLFNGFLSAAPADPDRALVSAGAAHILAAIAEQSRFAAYPSRREALAWRGRISDAVEALGDRLDEIRMPRLQSAASALSRSSRDLQAAVIADISETVGRLPQILSFTAGSDLDAWLLAAHVFGDTPDRIEAGYADIVARNAPRHPALLPAGAIEVLE